MRTPHAIVKKLNADIANVLNDPESRNRLGGQGLEPVVMTPEEVKRYTTQDTSRWAKLIQSAGIKQ